MNRQLRDVIAESIGDKLFEELEKCAVRSEALYTDRYLRGVGKTTALCKLALKHDLYLVVPFKAQESYIKSEFGSEVKVICQGNVNNLRGIKDVCLIFDEGVDPKNLGGFKVMTGIINNF